MRRRLSRRTCLLAVVALVAAAIGLAVQATGPFSQLERETVDARFSIRGGERPRGDVVIVAIDDKTLDNREPVGLDQAWPLRRRLHARLIDRLKAAGAKTIVFDLEFTQPTDIADDNALIEAIGRARNVVLVASAVGARGSTNVLGGDAVVRSVHATVGYSGFPTDRGGVLRRMWYRYHGLQSLAVAVATRTLGHPPPRRNVLGDGSAWIDYPGPRGTVPTVSYTDVLHGRVPASVFAGKIVVVGAADPKLQDLHATSTTRSDALMPGAEVEADAIATALDGFPLRAAPAAIAVLAIALLASIPALLGMRLGAIPALGLTVLGGAVFAVAAQLAFNGGVIISVVAPLLALTVSAVGALGVSYLEEAFHRQATRLAFSRFVPAAVVDEVLEAAGPAIRLGGVQRVATVMFSDLRGFTTFSEPLDPAQVIEILNRYLTVMAEAILAHGGTIVSYMGDGIMAVFGAPIAYDDHADRAVAAAREMLARLEDFNDWMTSRFSLPPLRMGIGLNTGMIMSGNVGSEQRLEYTAIGDTTNTAARLEGMTKGTPHQLFLAQSTYEALREARDDVVFVDELEVRGRQATVRVWAFEGEESPRASEDTAAFAAGLRAASTPGPQLRTSSGAP